MHHHVAVLAHQLAHAVAFVADDNGGRAGQIRLVHGDGAFGGGAVDPHALLLQLLNGGGNIGHPGHLHVLHRTGGSLGNGGSQADAAALGDDDTVGTGALGASEDSAQIMGVGQLIADHQQGSLPTGSGLLQKIVNGVVHMGGSQGDDALMGTGEGHGIQLPAIHRNHHGSGLLGLGSQPLQAPVGISGGDEHLVNGAAAFQGLGNGVAALQLAFHFLGRLGALGKPIRPVLGFTSLGTAFFVHKCSSISDIPNHNYR